MKKWIVLGLLCLLPFATQAYTISGSVTGGSGVKIAAAVPVELDTFYVGIVIPFLNTYSITNVPAGNYIVAAFADANLNGEIDAGESVGWWGGDFPDIVVLNGNVSGINISLATADGGNFYGLLSYGGSLHGASFVRVFTNPGFSGNPVGGGLIFQNDTGNGVYTGLTTTQGTFYADAFLDMNGNLEPDTDEPYGIYGGTTPTPFVVTPTTTPTDIDIDLFDPVTPPVENLIITLAGNDIQLSWSFTSPYTYFEIYRSTNPNVLPVNAQLLQNTTSMSFTDLGVVSLYEQVRYQVVVVR
ncbi:hypothetical protein KKG66_11920 [bacterium]|nr:hypothetical protein [bacterium]